MDTHARVMALAAEVLELDPAEIRDDMHLIDDLATTSVMRLEFLVALERDFDIHFKPAEIEAAQRLGEIAAVVDRYVQGKAS